MNKEGNFVIINTLADAIKPYTPSIGYNASLEYSNDRVHCVIQHYSPPVNNEEITKGILIDTWFRPMLFPSTQYNYFVNLFSIPQYTCDPSPVDYIGI
jgi:hypothetical protein